MKVQSIITTFILMIGISFQANAGNVLSADEIKALITGKTVHAKHEKKGFTFSAYFAEDGSAIRKWKGGELQDGKYSFKDNMHCINVGGGDKCATIEDNGDGTYKRLKGGKKHFITWQRIVDGKDL
ncbi:MAG: hypothetical protein EP297_13235 [Gammaproteobacteria bacterium]|nr:MAG: hypothetical protein EP297_13235 [Gammaproteobacteria bacterium]